MADVQCSLWPINYHADAFSSGLANDILGLQRSLNHKIPLCSLVCIQEFIFASKAQEFQLLKAILVLASVVEANYIMLSVCPEIKRKIEKKGRIIE